MRAHHEWTKVTVRLYREDRDFLARLYRNHGGYNHHIRECVHAMCQRLRAQLAHEGRLEAVLADIAAERQEASDAEGVREAA